MRSWKRGAIAALLLAGAAAVAIAGSTQLTGKVVAVSGNKVTVEITEGKARDLPLGTAVKLEAEQKKSKPPAAGNDMLQGC